MVNKLGKRLESSSGGVLSTIREKFTGIKTLAAGVAFSALATIGDVKKSEAAMNSADQVTEYSDLNKVRTDVNSPYEKNTVLLESGERLNASGDIVSSNGQTLSRLGISPSYSCFDVIDSTEYVIASYTDSSNPGSVRLAFYDKSNLSADPYVFSSDTTPVLINSVIGEVEFNNRNFVVLKAVSNNAEFFVFSPASGPAPSLAMAVDSSSPLYTNVVAPVINGLSSNGVDENDIVAAKNGISGKQTLVVKNQQGTFDIYEQTFDQGVNTTNPNPDVVMNLKASYTLVGDELRIPEADLDFEESVSIKVNGVTIPTQLSNDGTAWVVDLSQYMSSIVDGQTIEVIGEDADGDITMETTSIDIPRQSIVCEDGSTVENQEDCEVKMETPEMMIPSGFVVELGGDRGDTIELHDGMFNEHVESILFKFPKNEMGDEPYLSHHLSDGLSVQLNNLDWVPEGVSDVEVLLNDDPTHSYTLKFFKDITPPQVEINKDTIQIDDNSLAGLAETGMNPMPSHSEIFDVDVESEEGNVQIEWQGNVAKLVGEGKGKIAVTDYFGLTTYENFDLTKSIDEDQKDKDKDPVIPDGPDVTPPVDGGGNDDDPSCSAVVPGGKGAPVDPSLLGVAALGLVGAARRKKKIVKRKK